MNCNSPGALILRSRVSKDDCTNGAASLSIFRDAMLRTAPQDGGSGLRLQPLLGSPWELQ